MISINHTAVPANYNNEQRGLNGTFLKYIAIIAMTIDHVASAFVPSGTPLAIAMHFIGRITGPVMFYLAVEGYHHTRNIDKYMLRLGIFAIISYFPYMYFSARGVVANLNFINLNVIYTIFMGIAAIKVRRSGLHFAVKVAAILGIIVLCLSSDWGGWGLMIMLSFDFYYGNFKNQAFAYTLIVLLDVGMLAVITSPFQNLIFRGVFTFDFEHYKYSIHHLGLFLPLLLLSFYNGQKGHGGKFSKWIFYIYYPLHLLVLGFLTTLLK